MKTQILIITTAFIYGCVGEDEYEIDRRYLTTRIEVLEDRLERVDRQMMSHLCEYHSEDYDCQTLVPDLDFDDIDFPAPTLEDEPTD